MNKEIIPFIPCSKKIGSNIFHAQFCAVKSISACIEKEPILHPQK